MKYKLRVVAYSLSLLAAVLIGVPTLLHAQEKKPNIVVIMGDDIGMWNIGAYHRGLMA
ncbi:MAG: arylsulfatase, partial [Acidobacteria bacterium]